MITHYIIMSSSYSQGTRIALHYIMGDERDYEKAKTVLKYIIEKCGRDVSVSTHFIETESKSWDSVLDKDYFFKNVKLISRVDRFIKLIQNDRILNGLDVAKYILSKTKCTHLKLEKLVYLCFAEYLCNYGKELYEDKIYAYKYGPVVKSVYSKYKGYGYKEIEKETIDSTGIKEMPARSRIMFAEFGVEKISSIDDTIKKYGDLSAGDLVDLTHKTQTPWDVSGKGILKNEIISNDIIKKYHCNEMV